MSVFRSHIPAEEVEELYRDQPVDGLVGHLNVLVRDPWWTYEKAELARVLREELEGRGIDTSAAFEGDELRVDRRWVLDPSEPAVVVHPEDVEALEARYGPEGEPHPRAGGAPVRRGALVGWREWRMVEDLDTGEPALGSLWTPRVWEGPVLRAHPPTPDEDRPLSSLGIYGWRPELAHASSAIAPVEGHVLHYGRVIVHERGFRSEYVQVRDLTLRFCPELDRKEARFLTYMEAIGENNAKYREFFFSGWMDTAPGPMLRSDAEMLARSLSRRYECPVECKEMPFSELEELWKSVE